LEVAAPVGADWAAAPVGERDRRLLEFHEALFGAPLHTIARCPRCDGTLEADFAAGDIRVPPAPERPDTYRLQARQFDVEYRLPSSEDLLAVGTLGDAGRAQALLLGRCVVACRRGGGERCVDELPGEVVDRLIADMARHDPAADIQIGLRCPACGHCWS